MIPEAAVEAARRELAKGGYQMRPDELPYADAARRSLEAAAPHIAAQARLDAALELMDVQEHDSRMPGIRFAAGYLSGQRKLIQ